MSWLRSAVSKAVEAGGNNLTRTVKSYADTVVHHAGQAVAGGAKIFQDRMGFGNYKSFKLTVKRLEEASVSCRGIERLQLLQRWSIALKEIERLSKGSGNDNFRDQPQLFAETNSSPGNASLILFFDPDMRGEPLNFRDVFLHSQALEGITLSMILEAPSDEEVAILLEIFGLCLSGEKGVHNAIMSTIQDLARAFANYEEEVLVKREELLQFAQSAISGLKLNSEVARLEVEVSKMGSKVDEVKALRFSSDAFHDETSEKSALQVEDLKEALAEVRLCSRLEELLLKKRSIKSGDSIEIHTQKVDKLKVLAESLANSSSKAEKRILEHRHQKEEALNFRVAKGHEVSEFEKELLSEIAALEKQRDDLEAALKKVNISLAAATRRLKKTREESDQFDEASNQIVLHFKSKEDELSKAISSCKIEADIVHTWLNFLEDTWKLQSSYAELKEKQTNVELEKYSDCLLKLIKHHLSACKEDLGPSISRIRAFVDNLKRFNNRSEVVQSKDSETSQETNPKKFLEEEYLEAEIKIITAFSVVDHMRKLFYAEPENISRRDSPEVKELFASIEKFREDFDTIERPLLDIESVEKAVQLKERSDDDDDEEVPPAQTTISPKSEGTDTPLGLSGKPKEPDSQLAQTTTSSKSEGTGTPLVMSEKPKEPVSPKRSQVNTEEQLDPESEIAKLEMEFGKVGRDYSTDEIGGWEFDELEQELDLDSGSMSQSKK